MRETDPAKCAAIKTAKGIPEDHRVAILAMGRQGIGAHILKYMQLMNNPKNQYEKPVEVVVVCGKNAQLKQELEDYLKNLPDGEKNRNVHFRIEGFVEEKAMADYYKIADVLISKPGGATAAEAAAMGLPMLSCDPHVWELPNQDYLERHQLAEKLQSDETFVSQLNNLIARKEKGISYKPVDWQTQFSALMDGDKKQSVDVLPKNTFFADLITRLALRYLSRLDSYINNENRAAITV